MALTDIGEFCIPTVGIAADSTVSQDTIDATGEKVAYIFHIPKAGNITKIGFNTRTVAQDTNGLDVSLETVDSSGDPSGSGYKGSAAGNTGSGTSSNTWYLVTLGTQATSVVRGDVVAVVIGFTNFQAGDDVDIRVAGGTGNTPTAIPYKDLYAAAAWAKAKGTPNIALEYSDGSYAYIENCTPITNYSNENVASNTTPDEYGLKFTLGVGVRVIGAWLSATIDAVDDFDWCLYESDDTPVAIGSGGNTFSVDASQIGDNTQELSFFRFGAAAEIAAGTYRLTVKPTTTNQVALKYMTVDAAAIMGGFPLGTNAFATERTDAGAWTDTTTERPSMGLIIDQVDTGGAAASGGLIIHPGMTGGINA